MGWYRQGTASVANGSTAVTGTLTAWTSQAKAEDRITFDGGSKWYEVASVESNTALTLATAFGEATVTDGAYAIDRSGRGWDLVSDLAARVAALLAMFPVLAGASDALKWFRANAAGDAFEFTAVTPATITVGSTTTGAPGSSASVANSGTSSDAVLDFTIPRGDTGATGPAGPQGDTGPTGDTGPPGIVWRGDWVTATGYAATDGVQNSGSSYRCTAPHTSGATTEPGVGVDWATVWALLAAKGADGLGTGDVVGPASSADGEMALYDGPTGKLIKRASLTGMLKATSGVLAAATAGTDYVVPSDRRVAGDIFMSFDASPPSGCVELDGATISGGASTYPAVAARYPWMVVSGDLVLPDFRGRFPRGWAHGSSTDPDRASRTARAGDGQTGDYPGTYQDDQIKSHQHSVPWGHGGGGSSMLGLNSPGSTGTVNSNATGGNETRGKNLAVMFFMKMG